MTVRTRSQLNSDADTNLPDNTTGAISPADVRQSVKNLADSAFLAEDIPWTKATSSGPAALAFAEDTDNGAHAVSLKAPASIVANVDVVLPGTAGTLPLVSDVLLRGKHSSWMPAGAMKPRATSGAGEGTYDSGSNDITFNTLDFDTTTQEYGQFCIAMPKSWNEGTLTARFFWTNTGGSSTQTVRWSLAGRALGDDDAINGAFGTAVTVDDTWLAQNDMHISAETGALTIGNSPAEGDLVVFEVTRVVASDNMAGDAILVGIMFYLTINAGDDS